MSETRHTRLLIPGSGHAGYTAAVDATRAMLAPIPAHGTPPGGASNRKTWRRAAPRSAPI